MDIYEHCPEATTALFTLRLVQEADDQDLYECYHDPLAISFMNEDNCDFGFYVDSPEEMLSMIRYWLNHYGWRSFVRFAVVDHQTGRAVGTLEGFGGETGVLRMDLASAYETESCIRELLEFARHNFRACFGNTALVIKAIPAASERRKALEVCRWEHIGSFRDYPHYFKLQL